MQQEQLVGESVRRRIFCLATINFCFLYNCTCYLEIDTFSTASNKGTICNKNNFSVKISYDLFFVWRKSLTIFFITVFVSKLDTFSTVNNKSANYKKNSLSVSASDGG